MQRASGAPTGGLKEGKDGATLPWGPLRCLCVDEGVLENVPCRFLLELEA